MSLRATYKIHVNVILIVVNVIFPISHLAICYPNILIEFSVFILKANVRKVLFVCTYKECGGDLGGCVVHPVESVLLASYDLG